MGLYMITGAKVKTDRRDAFSLARLLRLDAILEAYIYPKDTRPIRDVLRRRTRMVRLRAEAYVAIKRKFQQYGLPYSDKAIQGVNEEELLRSFTHPGIRAGLEMEFERIRLYSRELKTIEKYILSTVKNKPIFEHLQTIPGCVPTKDTAPAISQKEVGFLSSPAPDSQHDEGTYRDKKEHQLVEYA